MKITKKTCQYKIMGGEPCPHDYFTTWADPETGEETDYCIFHAPMEVKEKNIDELWEAFDELCETTLYEFEVAKTYDEKEDIQLNCEGFVIPNTTGKFDNRKFKFLVDFTNAEFSETADFENIVFEQDVVFDGAEFKGDARFNRSRFLQDVSFEVSTFEGDSDFFETKFEGHVNLWQFTNKGNMYMLGAVFKGDVTFIDSFILGKLELLDTEFHKGANFTHLHTSGLKENEVGEIHLISVYFGQPGRVKFGRCGGFERWSFIGTNIENVNFIREEWPRRKTYLNKIFDLKPFRFINHRAKKYIFDEELAKNKQGSNGWSEVSEVYRKLRMNYESKLAYEAAGDFHYGQMECRLRDKERPIWERIPVFLYKHISGYGESFALPLVWLVLTLLLFTPWYLLLGFEIVDGYGIDWEWFTNFNPIGSGAIQWWSEFWFGICYSIKSALSFGISSEGYLGLVAGLEKALIATFVTFFVLALRRRFKR